jgi:hypothetical protein
MNGKDVVAVGDAPNVMWQSLVATIRTTVVSAVKAVLITALEPLVVMVCVVPGANA